MKIIKGLIFSFIHYLHVLHGENLSRLKLVSLLCPIKPLLLHSLWSEYFSVYVYILHRFKESLIYSLNPVHTALDFEAAQGQHQPAVVTF